MRFVLPNQSRSHSALEKGSSTVDRMFGIVGQCNFVAEREPKVPFQKRIATIVFIVLNAVSDNIAAC